MTRHLGWALLGWLVATTSHAAAPPARPLTDANGDPLPDGAAARLGTLRWRPGTYLTDLAWSPDGKWVASADASLNTARLWDASTGRVVRTFWGHRGGVLSVSFSPDGKRLASAADDGTARIWDLQTGKQLRLLRGVARRNPQVTFGAKGKSVTVLDNFGLVVRFDADTGKSLGRIQLERESGDHILSPRGDRIVLGRGNAIAVWDAVSGKSVCAIPVAGKPTSLRFSADGKQVAARESSGEVRVWRVESGEEVCKIPAKGAGKQ